MLEYIQELPALEHPLAETEQPVGKNLNEQRMDKPILRSGTKTMLGDVPEPPKPRKLEPKRHRGGHHRSERRRQDEARKGENEAKMSDMSQDKTPPWIQNRYEASADESIGSFSDEVSQLEKLKEDPRVIQKLDEVLKQSYEECSGEPFDFRRCCTLQRGASPWHGRCGPSLGECSTRSYSLQGVA